MNTENHGEFSESHEKSVAICVLVGNCRGARHAITQTRGSDMPSPGTFCLAIKSRVRMSILLLISNHACLTSPLLRISAR